MLRLMQGYQALTCNIFPSECPCRADEEMSRAQRVLTMTKQMLFFIARVDALPFNTISTEDVQQPGDRNVCEK